MTLWKVIRIGLALLKALGIWFATVALFYASLSLLTSWDQPLKLLAAVCVEQLSRIVFEKRRERRKAKLRLVWRQRIEQIADDLTTDPNGMSLDQLMNWFDEPEWRNLYDELEKMPPGKRSLQKAIE